MRDAEADGLPTLGADGDDGNGSADEDGVTFGEIRVGPLDAQVTVNVQNAPGGAKLDAWIDFNGDGAFGGAGEQIADTVEVSEGDNVVEFDVPSWAVDGDVYARFRLSSAGDLAPRGVAADGEVEDRAVALLPPRQGSGVFAIRELPHQGLTPEQVFPADVDSDGDMDLLAAFWFDDRIAWYENDGTQEFTFHTISVSAERAISVFATDVDSDGDVDVLSASIGDGKIAWYRNDGSEVFTRPHNYHRRSSRQKRVCCRCRQ